MTVQLHNITYNTVEAHCCVGVLVMEVLDKIAAAGLTNNNSMSRTFRSRDLSQLVQHTKLT